MLAKGSPTIRQTSTGWQGFSREARQGQSSAMMWSGSCRIRSRARVVGDDLFGVGDGQVLLDRDQLFGNPEGKRLAVVSIGEPRPLFSIGFGFGREDPMPCTPHSARRLPEGMLPFTDTNI